MGGEHGEEAQKSGRNVEGGPNERKKQQQQQHRIELGGYKHRMGVSGLFGRPQGQHMRKWQI